MGLEVRLPELFTGIDVRLPPRAEEVDVRALAVDSRKVGPGALFAALQGVVADGADFAPQAVERGAAAVLSDRELEVAPAALIVAPDARRAFSQAASRFHGEPSSPAGRAAAKARSTPRPSPTTSRSCSRAWPRQGRSSSPWKCRAMLWRRSGSPGAPSRRRRSPT